ncbi:MAG: nucleotidyl transferase AbiEii/AbiGii toxin family protein, partial [Prevotella sp.]|nr:nucleotidyl transferase AbiEii/AbiGii toxin family protein [Prevotella sp.]
MKLHTNQQLFKDAINYASRPIEDGGLGISPLFIEKDYWTTRCLKLMSEKDKDKRAVFKGGTSLSKAYGIGARFSEDLDVAISEAWTLSGNQLKNLIRKTAHNMTEGLEEIPIPGKTSKGSHYHKAYYHYPQVIETLAATSVNPGQILVEINSFANPYPSELRVIQSFLTTFLKQSNNGELIEEYEMQPFEIMVLDKRRTLTEKLVSLIRCSLANEYLPQLSSKIRHFYDLYYL